jgi:DNA-binding SARP family transcriptional activator
MERSAPRSKVTALFYPEIDEEQARRRLNQSIYAIRQDLGNDCILTWGGELRAGDALKSDACEFGNLAECGDYARAFEIYQRPFLDGFYLTGTAEWERWVDRRRAVLARTFVLAARLLIKRLIEQQDFGAASACAARWIELDGYSEEAHRLLMTALTRAGCGNDALRHYQDWERELRENDGVAPSDQMAAFVANLRKDVEALRITPIELVQDPPPKVRPMVLQSGQESARPAERMVAGSGNNTFANLRRALRRYLDRRIAL